MGDYGIKIAKPGKSVYSEDPRDFNLWSKFPVFKVAQTGGGSFTANGANSGVLSIAHNLGYNPIVFFWYKNVTDGDAGMKFVQSIFEPTVFGFDCRVENRASDLNNAYFIFNVPGGGTADYEYYYYFMYDEGVS